jgi:hypothetical protein
MDIGRVDWRVILVDYFFSDGGPAMLEALAFGAIEVEGDDRVALKVGKVDASGLPDLKILEQV